MNLLITGGAGFIGSNLIHHVIDRPEIRKLVNLPVASQTLPVALIA